MKGSFVKGARMVEGAKRKDGRSLSFALGLVIVLFLAGRFFFFDIATVEGKSMQPLMEPGDLVLVWKAAYGLAKPFGGYFFTWAEPENRDIVAALNPLNGAFVVKRVSSHSQGFLPEGSYFLLGDNFYESVDSREFGPVPMRNILGKVLRLPRL